jgi:hypothetical protein
LIFFPTADISSLPLHLGDDITNLAAIRSELSLFQGYQ